uniref:Engulfment and cell motility 2 n=1 Tax=Varanus komodoensis TaxID=61221 RepID=A0A8D2PZC1_VARKO
VLQAPQVPAGPAGSGRLAQSCPGCAERPVTSFGFLQLEPGDSDVRDRLDQRPLPESTRGQETGQAAEPSRPALHSHHPRQPPHQDRDGPPAVRASGPDLQPPGRTDDDQDGPQRPGTAGQHFRAAQNRLRCRVREQQPPRPRGGEAQGHVCQGLQAAGLHEPPQPGLGLHPDPAWDTGIGQHAVPRQVPPGHLRAGKRQRHLPEGQPPAVPPHISFSPQLVLENSSREDKHECPFGRSAIELTKMLCEILQVGELPNEGRNDYHPMFFTHDRAFEELFTICIQLLNKTWKEMRATAEDFNKVMQVVREQITRALPSRPSSLDQFKSKLRSLSYSEVLRLRQSERMSQDDFQSPPVVELREKIRPEILELIKQQRLNRLCEGSSFRKIGNRRRQERFWYCRLALNHKVLHYGDLEDNAQGEVTFESLQEKIPVADIKAIVTGKDCPHMKEKGALKQNKVPAEECEGGGGPGQGSLWAVARVLWGRCAN